MSVTYPKGFQASGTACGIKTNGNLDLAIIASSTGESYPSAATFTQNLAAAASVRLSRSHLDTSLGYTAAVLLSSGNANAATGTKGDADALASANLLAGELGVEVEQILVASTGLIGIPMPIDRLLSGIPLGVKSLGDRDDHGLVAAKALMTTDTFAKVASFEHKGVRFGGIAKGAAMISPNMATMLAVITTDAQADAKSLSDALSQAVDQSFNRITIDGCTSTNDSVFVLASGQSEIDLGQSDLFLGISAICNDLAKQIVFDAEGATKVIFIEVSGAKTVDDAVTIGRKIANSPLVKCSFFGQDPYWGRVLSEVGSAGVALDITRVSISYGDTVVYKDTQECKFDSEHLTKLMSNREIHLGVDVGCGNATATITTADLTPAYIAENMRTS